MKDILTGLKMQTERTKKNRLLYLKNKILCVFDIERMKLKKEIRKLKSQVKKRDHEIERLNLIIEEITANNEFLHNEVATLKKRLRKKTQNEINNGQIK